MTLVRRFFEKYFPAIINIYQWVMQPMFALPIPPAYANTGRDSWGLRHPDHPMNFRLLVRICPEREAGVHEVRAWFSLVFRFYRLGQYTPVARNIDWTGEELYNSSIRSTRDMLHNRVGMPYLAAESLALNEIEDLLSAADAYWEMRDKYVNREIQKMRRARIALAAFAIVCSLPLCHLVIF
ncbi:hypothetical protein GQ53DRAFT_818303 [Thozetella sp. PMI_491]|nr:hypothetical protein GQ53DRAFT_818303 [Thozetella sp. PMI_491]